MLSAGGAAPDLDTAVLTNPHGRPRSGSGRQIHDHVVQIVGRVEGVKPKPEADEAGRYRSAKITIKPGLTSIYAT